MNMSIQIKSLKVLLTNITISLKVLHMNTIKLLIEKQGEAQSQYT